MSESIGDFPFDDSAFERDLATPEDLRVLENLAKEAARKAPYEEQSHYYYGDEGEGQVVFGVLQVETRLDLPKHVIASVLTGEETVFQMILDQSNQFISISFDKEEGLWEAIAVTQKVLDSGDIPSETEIKMVQYLRDFMLSTLDDPTVDEDALLDGDVIVGTIREQVEINKRFTVRRREREYELRDDGNMNIDISVLTTEFPGDAGPQDIRDDIPGVQIAMTNFNTAVRYVYLSEYGGNEPRLFVRSMMDEDLPTARQYDSMDEAREAIHDLDRIRHESGIDTPGKEEVGEIFNLLLEADLAKEFNQEPEKVKKWVYPEIPFGFDFSVAIESGNPSANLHSIVSESLRSLQDATQVMLPLLSEKKMFEHPNYSYSPNKLHRIGKFLSHTMIIDAGGGNEKVRRNEVLDVKMAAFSILDELSEENHPISQMIASIYDGYVQELGDDTIEKVVIEVMLLTQWPKMRRVLHAQAGYYRPEQVRTRR